MPVFIDADPVTGNADCSQLEAAYTPGKTKAVMMAHALGNPFDLAATLAFCKKYDLWLIEDNCDALGCTYSLPLDLAKELGLDHLIKIAEKGEHPVIRITHHPPPTTHHPFPPSRCRPHHERHHFPRHLSRPHPPPARLHDRKNPRVRRVLPEACDESVSFNP